MELGRKRGGSCHTEDAQPPIKQIASAMLLFWEGGIMETRKLGKRLLDKNGTLYLMLVIAAMAVIIFSAFGVATMTGLLPRI